MIFLLSIVCVANTFALDYNFQKGSILFNYLDGKGGLDSNESTIVKNANDFEKQQSSQKSYTSLAKLASADPNFIRNLGINTDDTENNYGYDMELSLDSNLDLGNAMVQNNSFVSTSNYYDESLENLKYGIIKYKVEPGDSPGSIATSFGISTYTVLWVNNLKVGDYIKPNQELEILPVTGVKHAVKATDSIESIAKKYKAEKDEIIEFNDLPADGTLAEGKVLIVPNGEKEAPIKPRPQPTNSGSKVISTSKYVSSSNPKRGHRFPYGYCTWYVASKVYVPWSGHAKSWLVNARALGYRTGKTPVPGSIVVTTEHRLYGHVAYVEAVHGNTITLSEMNYVGWGRKSVRVIPVTSPVIRGYIYVQ